MSKCDHPLYVTYRGMLRRCYDPKAGNFRNYGGRGISVCNRWQGQDGFRLFVTDMGAKPGHEYELDRIDNNGSYNPANCRWATRSDNARNSRPRGQLVEYNGELKTLPQWCNEFNVSYPAVKQRLKSGWPLHQALSLGVRKNGHTRRKGEIKGPAVA